METGSIYRGFLLKEKKYVKEERSTVHIFEHVKTGARLLYMQNSEENKVFSISFATLPEDSTGVAHIIEHSVLCGSEAYPLKDPFVRLLNSSLNTFLNAMTFMDKTMYPVASMNEKDFSNLVGVYCDAVFLPLIRTDDTAFLQEGWHYETDGEALGINGIVYNEMKGVYSDPEEVLSETVGRALFPDTGYAYDSGGDPEVIPHLTYEKYLEFYKKNYSPSNSYIFIYGDTDIDARLRDLDEKYLSRFEKTPLPERRYYQKPFAAPAFIEREYSVSSPEEEEGSSYFARAYAFDTADIKTLSALGVLVKILFDTDVSYLKKALTDAGIAGEIVHDFTAATAQPYFTIAAKNADASALTEFGRVIDSCLESLASGGIDEDMILAALNNYEFDLRESDSGSYPKGLVTGIRVMDSWLYGRSPFEQLEYEDTLKYLRENMTSAFYQELIRKYLLSNTHSATVVLTPRAGLSEKKASELESSLREKYLSMDEAEKAKVADSQKRLAERMASDDSEEALASIPVLNVSEISSLPRRYQAEKEAYGPGRIITYTDVCSGIVYADASFEIRGLTMDEISMLDLVTETLGVYPTASHTEEELANMTGIYLGDTDVSVSLSQNITDPMKYSARFVFSAKALSENTDRLFDIAREILTETRYTDCTRLLRTVTEEMSKFTYNMVSNAESMAANMIASAFTPRGYFKELEKGQACYRKLSSLKERLEKNDETVLSEMNALLSKLIDRRGLDILLICDSENAAVMKRGAKAMMDSLPEGTAEGSFGMIRKGIHEGIIIPSDVCYAGLGANVATLGSALPAAAAFVRKYLRTNYLWDMIRVRGGAYGAILSTDRGGDVILMSYRDPNVKRTYDVYRNIPEVLSSIKLSPKEINDLTVGTISDIDMPLQVYSRGRRVLLEEYTANTWEKQCEIRSAVLGVTQKDVRDASGMFALLWEKGLRVSIGNAEKINEASDLFENIYTYRRDGSND